jgi:hypothetical protein
MPSKPKPIAKSATRKRPDASSSSPRAKHASAVATTPRRVKPKASTPIFAPLAAKSSKQSQLIALLRAPAGTSIDQMTGTTGWQPHTVRGVISGVLRKRLGLNVACSSPNDAGIRTYRIVDGT